jgi:hypothetical protein
MGKDDLDLIDIIVATLFIAITAQNPGFIAVPLLLIWFLQWGLRRTYMPSTQTKDKALRKIQHWIADVDERQTGPLQLTEVLDSGDIIKRLVKISFTDIPKPDNKWMVPVGLNYLNQWEWLNIENGITHALVAGQSGTGKDNLLRLWFTVLTRQNRPDEIKFAIIDGKGEWLLEPIAQSAYMFTPPAGGINIEHAKDWREAFSISRESMERALEAVFRELGRRQRLFTAAGVVSRERYEEKTGNKLPLLVLICTDVGTELEKDVDKLIQIIVSKGRSLGIRAILSMQTPTGQSAIWRTNVSVVITGRQQQGSQDNPTLGTLVKDMLLRPSQLPDPQERPGVMIMRRGDYQTVVSSPYFPESFWEAYIERLPPNNARLLQDLLKL